MYPPDEMSDPGLAPPPLPGRKFPKHWIALPAFLGLALLGFALGAEVSERQKPVDVIWLARVYQAASLFVFGGIDLGTPIGGSALARVCLWVAYFGAPLVTASAVVEAILRIVGPDWWWQLKLRRHVVIVGSGELASAYLRRLRSYDPQRSVVLVDDARDAHRLLALGEAWGVHSHVRDLDNRTLFDRLRITRAVRVILLGDRDLSNLDLATAILEHGGDTGPKIVVHASDLRMLRTFCSSEIGRRCDAFNTYHLAASAFLSQQLLPYFRSTPELDVVVLAGFGRFGQTIYEELRYVARGQLSRIGVLDFEIEQKLRIADESRPWVGECERIAVEGDLRDPWVWQQMAEQCRLSDSSPVLVLATGSDEENVRAALSLAERYPRAQIFVRTHRASRFVEEAGRNAAIHALSILELVGQGLSASWYRVGESETSSGQSPPP